MSEKIDMRKAFLALDINEQQAVTNYFNLHNAAIWIFQNLSAPAQDWITESIRMSQETDHNNEELIEESKAEAEMYNKSDN